MRFYKIKMSDQDGKPVTPSSLSTSGPAALIGSGTAPATEPGVITSLLSDGTTNPGALDVELQVDQMTEAIGDFRSFVRIFGLGIRDISHGFDLNPSLDGKRYTNIELSVGMAKGLPLADPSQQGTILAGTIWQAFGNWLGTEMTLDLVVGPGGLTGKPEQPKSYVFTWTKGQKLADAISNTIQNNPALSKLKTSLTVSDDRVANEDKSGYYVTATEFAQLIQNMTVRQRGDTDQGVQLYITPQAVIAGEIGGAPQQGQSVKQIKFEDLLGQITWIEPLKLTAKVVMRGDLNLLDYVKFPPNAITQTTATALPSVAPSQRESDSLGIASGGSFQIIQMHHYGRYRQPDAMSWNTTLVLAQSQNAV